MRSIRNAAVAGATALALTLGGTAAFAQEDNAASLSSQFNTKYEMQGEKGVYGVDAWGTKALTAEDLPNWFNTWKGFTIAGIVLTIITMLIAPAYNWAVYNGYIQ